MSSEIFRYAPPPTAAAGLVGVPIHIDRVTGTIVFDGATKTASATAVMEFTVGPNDGNPVFDLRQTIGTATLDGAPIAASSLAHHSMGGGAGADVRVISQWMTAGSSHVLELTYPVGTPQSNNAGPIGWSSTSARLAFNIFLSDLNPARYLESWLPSNLLFDRFPVDLEIEIQGTSFDHVLLSNAATTPLGTNHWQLNFPDTFASCSPLVLIDAVDRVTVSSSTVLVAGVPISIELMKKADDTGVDLAAQRTIIAGLLTDNHTAIGPYLHGNRFVALLSSGAIHSMEYAGGTTSSLSAVEHETFHSWWARGMTPATGGDGWIDEAWTSFNTPGAAPFTQPFDLTDPPIEIWTNNPWRRFTPGISYSHKRFFAGLASELGLSTLQSAMASIYSGRRTTHLSTPELEAGLIKYTSRLDLARFFDRFVYGHSGSAPGTHPNLVMRDHLTDSGAEPSSGTFWQSPDVWVRHADDGGVTHEGVEYGQDNWLHARVWNHGTATAPSVVVGFRVQTWAGTEFVYPGDWLPFTAVGVGHDLGPGDSVIVSARWRSEDVPPAGTHGCLLAVAYSPDDPATNGANVWHDNNLAQRNITIVDLEPNECAEIPMWFGSQFSKTERFHTIEIHRPKEWRDLDVSVRRPSGRPILDVIAGPAPIRKPDRTIHDVLVDIGRRFSVPGEGVHLAVDAGVGSRLLVQSELTVASRSHAHCRPAATRPKDGDASRIHFDGGLVSALPVHLPANSRHDLAIQFCAPRNARVGDEFDVPVVQRDERGRVVGGNTFRLRITKPASAKHLQLDTNGSTQQ